MQCASWWCGCVASLSALKVCRPYLPRFACRPFLFVSLYCLERVLVSPFFVFLFIFTVLLAITFSKLKVLSLSLCFFIKRHLHDVAGKLHDPSNTTEPELVYLLQKSTVLPCKLHNKAASATKSSRFSLVPSFQFRVDVVCSGRN